MVRRLGCASVAFGVGLLFIHLGCGRIATAALDAGDDGAQDDGAQADACVSLRCTESVPAYCAAQPEGCPTESGDGGGFGAGDPGICSWLPRGQRGGYGAEGCFQVSGIALSVDGGERVYVFDHDGRTSVVLERRSRGSDDMHCVAGPPVSAWCGDCLPDFLYSCWVDAVSDD